jgi:HEAT repeat protein
MGSELKKIIEMIGGDDADLACAAMKVVAELRPSGKGATAAIAGILKKGVNEDVNRCAIETLGRLGDASAAEAILPFCSSSAVQVRQAAINALAVLGPEVMEHLVTAFEKAEGHEKHAVLDVVENFTAGGAFVFLFECLRDPDFEVVKHAYRAFSKHMSASDDSRRRKLCPEIQNFVKKQKSGKNRTPVVSGLKLLGQLKDPSTADFLIGYASPKQDDAVRTNAMMSLLALDLSKAKLGNSFGKSLLGFAGEERFSDVVRMSLELLQRFTLGAESLKDLLKLAESPHFAVRIFSGRLLGQVGGTKAFAALMGLLNDPDERVRGQAEVSLRSNAEFTKCIVDELVAAKDTQLAARLARIAGASVGELPPKSAAALTKRSIAEFERNVELGRVLMGLLLRTNPGVLDAEILKKGRALRLKGKLDEAEKWLSLAETNGQFGLDTRYELALTRLAREGTDISDVSRKTSHSLPIFAQLLRSGLFPLTRKLSADKDMTPAHLLFVGFHFAEQERPEERELGSALLKLLVERHPRSKESQTARQKIGTEGVTA